MDRARLVPPATQNPHERNVIPTETALHRTRLHTLLYKVFSVLNSYKIPRQPAPWLGLCGNFSTEKIEKNFSVFQFLDLGVDREKILVR
ncbi:hypothetical protein NE897_10355 [Yersinia ruckeri]|uniref:hypothetical protein n=1 Tax=Yersinia ruckeri TaxID=29486 RepID=UPI002238FD6B|nr:hypothetical protein [Yersinia ruckeri]MCW6546083.1 hypothetical protein [Yersinia ruckeri]MCW6571339.1 hypothetical protein [Yersinia ruckeri]